MIIVIVTCKDKGEATNIAKHLLEEKLVACAKVMLIAKTIESKWKTIEKEVLALHSYENPEIYAIPASQVSKKYLKWVEEELVDPPMSKIYNAFDDDSRATERSTN